MIRRFLALFVCLNLLTPAWPQQAPLTVVRPTSPIPIRSYEAITVPPIRLQNSQRLYQLIRAGKLYLTAQDAIALAIENNLDLEVSRYGPLNAEWQLNRAEAGGPLRGVVSGSSQIGQVASGQGVAGSQASAGLGGSGGGGGGGGTGGAAVSQIGPVTANLDPVIQNTTLFSHVTSPQVNTRQSQTTSLVSTSHIYNTSVQQGLLTGGFAQISFRESYLKENTPTSILNPSFAPRMYFYLQHNLLQGFGTRVNGRFIRIAGKNVTAAGETFRSELIDLIARVLNLYWGLVVDLENLQSRQRALDLANKFFRDTRKEIEIGVLSRVDIYRPEAEVGTRKREFEEAKAAVEQQQNLLKNAISRIGMEDPLLDQVGIVPLDKIRVPEEEAIPPLRELVATALKKRPDVLAAQIRQENAGISALGTASGVLPQLVGLAQVYTSGLAGRSQPFQGVEPDPDLVGGIGAALGQVFRGRFANERGAVYAHGIVRNRTNQGDYGADQLQLRQTELKNLRDRNQMVVDISNQVIALRQARARYATANNTHTLQQELLQKEQRMFSLGASTINDVITAQRNLVTAEIAEGNALSAYSRARIGLDQILGETLEKNNVSLADALEGRGER
ncbi:MAG: TolC family protein [Bryobacterales bacterium]|nr:TolC family protein [Bryobacterales bacterium]